ncbi:MAG: DUF5715 family protein [Acidobacteriaceae bacterium]
MSLVLACGLAASPSALAAHRHTRHKSAHSARVQHHKVHAGHHPASLASKTSRESVKEHRSAHRPVAAHRAVHHSARRAKHVAERRTVHHSRRAATLVAASHPAARPSARPEAESKNLAETIPPIPMRDGHLYMPPPLLGSHASLVRQNQRGEAEGLSRIQNVAQLNTMRRDGALVPLPVGATLLVSRDLPVDRRCTRPWTAKFLTNLAHAHYVRFDRPLQINSAVRTVRFQRRLIRVNANAAPATGDIASPHLMGATIDIAKKGLSLSEVAWMRAYLLPLEQDGKIDVEEEFYQSCFHITVYKSYMPKTRKTRHTPTTLLATGVR